VNGITALRRFAREKPPRIERCELCAAPIGPRHDHLVDPREHQLKCSCQACAILFPQHADSKFRRVSPRADLLTEFRLTDAQWESLRLPIGLAFFLRSRNGIAAFYPGPAGATESLVPLDAWQELESENALALAPDVEALLVHRVGSEREHYIVSIDHCYRLTGILRKHWRGFSGGEEAATQIRQFFDELRGGPRA
jgi:hypothetical protein